MGQRIFGLAQWEDLPAIAKIYQNVLENKNSRQFTGWVKGIYPTERTACEAYEEKELFICKDGAEIIAAARINHQQAAFYKDANWEYDAPENEVMVLHTLVVDPCISSKGCGSAFVQFYEEHALKIGCHYLRMDTNEKNTPARSLYKKLGYKEVGIVPCDFSGIPDMKLVCLEKKLP